MIIELTLSEIDDLHPLLVKLSAMGMGCTPAYKLQYLLDALDRPHQRFLQFKGISTNLEQTKAVTDDYNKLQGVVVTVPFIPIENNEIKNIIEKLTIDEKIQLNWLIPNIGDY